MERASQSKDYYEILGVPEDASTEDITRGYRNRARELHPDRGGSEEDMKLLNEAHDILGNEITRREYDQERRSESPSIPFGSSAVFDPEAASKMGTLEIKVADPDYFGLLVGTAMCIGLGLPFLALIESQYVFFLWPLRLLTIGALLIGVMMAHAALRMRRSKYKKAARSRPVLEEMGFWIAVGVVAAVTYFFLYAR